MAATLEQMIEQQRERQNAPTAENNNQNNMFKNINWQLEQQYNNNNQLGTSTQLQPHPGHQHNSHNGTQQQHQHHNSSKNGTKQHQHHTMYNSTKTAPKQQQLLHFHSLACSLPMAASPQFQLPPSLQTATLIGPENHSS
jgi:hypothetical protein